MTFTLKFAFFIACILNKNYLARGVQSCNKDSEDGDDCNKYTENLDDENNDQARLMTWITMPENERDLERVYMERKLDHPALAMAYASAKIQRSTKQAFILLLGLTGSGKSSTINYLFDKYIAPTSDRRSETKSAIEYSVSMKSYDYKISNLTLSIIDTPGFADTDGMEQDAKNLASIKQFLQVHPFLRTNFPNLVYLVVKINDNRMFGPDSQLSKLLKGMQILNAVDKHNNNLVVILSHACAIARNPIKWKEKVEQKIQDVKSHVESFLGVLPEVIAQETAVEDCDMEKDGDWHVLPDGRLQPKQLFEASKSLFERSNDELGYEAIRNCFRPKTQFTVNKGFSVSSNDVKKDEITKMRAKLLQTVIATSESEVSRLLDKYYEEKDIPTLYHDILNLKIRLNDLDMKEPRDLQRLSSMNQLKSIMLPTHVTSQMEKVITDLFGLKFEEHSGHFNLIGKGFNPFKDAFTFTFPLELGMEVGGKLGLRNNVQLYDTNSYEIKYQSVRDYNQYIKERLHELQISYDAGINFKLFDMNVRGGYNIRDTSKYSSEQTTNINSFLVEQKIYKYTIRQPFQLSKSFVQDITSLPPSYNTNDENNFLNWERFFGKWGYYAIIGGYLGGSVTGEVKLQNSESSSFDSADIQRELATKLSFLSVGGEVSYRNEVADRENTQQKSSIATSSLKWIGGDRSVFKNSLEDVGIQEWDKWVKSLEYFPEPLWTSLDLYPMYLLVADVDGQKAQEMQKITNLALTGRFKYEPPKRETRETISQSKPPKSCFPANAKLFLANGKTVNMEDIAIGQMVSSTDSNSLVKTDKIITWLHRKENVLTLFLEIIHEFGTLTISSGHILFVGKERKPRMASQIQVGDKLYYYENQKIGDPGQLVVVKEINEVERIGIYAPLTWNGNLIVDGVGVSCYAEVNPLRLFGNEVISSQSVAHFGFLPLRLAYISGIDIGRNKIDSETGLHIYALWLLNNALDKLNWILTYFDSTQLHGIILSLSLKPVF